MWNIFFVVVLIIIIIIIVVFFLLLIFGIYEIDDKVNQAISQAERFIEANTQINPKTDYVIDYSQNPIPTGFSGTDFSDSLAVFLDRCTMSSVIFADLTINNKTPTRADLQLPPQLELVTSVGTRAILLKRQGQEFYILANRGTLTVNDWINDFAANQVQYFNLDNQPLNNALVHDGFYSDWRTLVDQYNAAWAMIPDGAQVIVTGHSEGCAHAQFTTVAYQQKTDKSAQLAMYIYASPRVSNNVFADYLNTNIPNNWTINNQNDIVPAVPPAAFIVNDVTYDFDMLTNRVVSDIQLGSLSENHYLDSYLCSIDPSASECPPRIIWQNPYRLLCLPGDTAVASDLDNPVTPTESDDPTDSDDSDSDDSDSDDSHHSSSESSESSDDSNNSNDSNDSNDSDTNSDGGHCNGESCAEVAPVKQDPSLTTGDITQGDNNSLSMTTHSVTSTSCSCSCSSSDSSSCTCTSTTCSTSTSSGCCHSSTCDGSCAEVQKIKQDPSLTTAEVSESYHSGHEVDDSHVLSNSSSYSSDVEGSDDSDDSDDSDSSSFDDSRVKFANINQAYINSNHSGHYKNDVDVSHNYNTPTSCLSINED